MRYLIRTHQWGVIEHLLNTNKYNTTVPSNHEDIVHIACQENAPQELFESLVCLHLGQLTEDYMDLGTPLIICLFTHTNTHPPYKFLDRSSTHKDRIFQKIKFLVREEPRAIFWRNTDQDSALDISVQIGDLELTKYILGIQAHPRDPFTGIEGLPNIYSYSSEDTPPFTRSARNGDHHLMMYFLETYPNKTAYFLMHRSNPIKSAAIDGQVTNLEQLLIRAKRMNLFTLTERIEMFKEIVRNLEEELLDGSYNQAVRLFLNYFPDIPVMDIFFDE